MLRPAHTLVLPGKQHPSCLSEAAMSGLSVVTRLAKSLHHVMGSRQMKHAASQPLHVAKNLWGVPNPEWGLGVLQDALREVLSWTGGGKGGLGGGIVFFSVYLKNGVYPTGFIAIDYSIF